ncbi:hypothetical protein CDIK_2332 [Cucumispora dikerogammari]|nr:hypothetical protein CDIK_2332 [Cucumispora dikerogammari]
MLFQITNVLMKMGPRERYLQVSLQPAFSVSMDQSWINKPNIASNMNKTACKLNLKFIAYIPEYEKKDIIETTMTLISYITTTGSGGGVGVTNSHIQPLQILDENHFKSKFEYHIDYLRYNDNSGYIGYIRSLNTTNLDSQEAIKQEIDKFRKVLGIEGDKIKHTLFSFQINVVVYEDKNKYYRLVKRTSYFRFESSEDGLQLTLNLNPDIKDSVV